MKHWMNGKSRAVKIMLIVCAINFLVGTALLLPATIAKYTDKIIGYTGFKAERFNAAILPGDPASPGESGDGDDTAQVGENNADGTVAVDVSGWLVHPGMVWSENTEEDTSARTSFYVANGTAEENATSTDLQYTIRLRTAQSLPLTYKLLAGDQYYETQPGPQRIAGTSGEPRYEYIFVPVSNGTTQADNTEDTAQTTAEEATFMLQHGEEDGLLIKNLHELIVEWPADPTISGKEYMKEVEIVEILVTVTSLNKFEDPNYGTTISEDQEWDYYASGVLLLRPPTSGTVNSYAYEIDLRSFHKESPDSTSDGGIFKVELTNAVGMGVLQSSSTIDYQTRLKVPIELLEAPEDAPTYSFTVAREMGATSTDLTSAFEGYRIYNETDGTYEEYTELDAAKNALAAKDKPQYYRIYAIYRVGESATLTNKKAGSEDLQNDSHTYIITCNQLTQVLDEIAFLNKLELLVEAEFKGS